MVEYKLKRNYALLEVMTLCIHENLALPIGDIVTEKGYDYMTFKGFKPVNPDLLTDEDRYDIMCQFHNLFAFLENHHYQVVGIELEDIAIIKNSKNPDLNNHLLVHKLEVKKANYFRPCNDYMIAFCAKMLGNEDIKGEIKPCRRMKQSYIVKHPQYLRSVKTFAQ